MRQAAGCQAGFSPCKIHCAHQCTTCGRVLMPVHFIAGGGAGRQMGHQLMSTVQRSGGCTLLYCSLLPLLAFKGVGVCLVRCSLSWADTRVAEPKAAPCCCCSGSGGASWGGCVLVGSLWCMRVVGGCRLGRLVAPVLPDRPGLMGGRCKRCVRPCTNQTNQIRVLLGGVASGGRDLVAVGWRPLMIAHMGW